jgi:queuine tRNA-ribosyltransferase
MLPALEAALGVLPVDRPRYFMGLGDPLGIVDAVARGVDMFDCVLPTRLARHGTLLTSEGRLNLRNRRFADDTGPLDPACACPVCARWSRGYLRHLLSVAEPTAPRLLTVHNVAWTFALVDRIRAAIGAGTLAGLRAEVAERWEVGAGGSAAGGVDSPGGAVTHGPDGGTGGNEG